MCLQQSIPRSKSLYLHFQLSQSPRPSQRCRSFPYHSGLDCLSIDENSSRSPLLTEGFHDDIDNNNYYASHQQTTGCDGTNSSESRLLSVSLRACSDNDKLGNWAVIVGSDVSNPSTSSLHCISPHAGSDYEERDSVGSDEFNPSGSLLPRSSPRANTNLAMVEVNSKLIEGYVGSNPSGDVAISVGSHDESTDFDQEHLRTRVTPLEWIFLLAGLGLEILSAGFDQVSSPQKPRYALISLLLAIAGMLTCIWELIYNGMKDRDASPNRMVFGSLPDIFGLGLAVIQCVCSAVQYYFLQRHTSNPMKVSPVPLFFFSCLVVLKFKKN